MPTTMPHNRPATAIDPYVDSVWIDFDEEFIQVVDASISAIDEDVSDIEAMNAALNESDELIPYDDIRKELGLQ